jgi:hypothetical protein
MIKFEKSRLKRLCLAMKSFFDDCQSSYFGPENIYRKPPVTLKNPINKNLFVMYVLYTSWQIFLHPMRAVEDGDYRSNKSF